MLTFLIIFAKNKTIYEYIYEYLKKVAVLLKKTLISGIDFKV